MIHVNEIKFEGDSPWVKQFNYCSDLWAKATDKNSSEEERDKYFRKWETARFELETGVHGRR